MLRAKDREWLHRASLRMLVTIGLLTSSTSAIAASGNPDGLLSDPSIAFDATWDWAQLSAKTFNGSPKQEHRLTLHGRIEVLDGNDLLGMCVSDPDILQVIDGSGNPVEWEAVPSSHVRSYQRLAYYHVLKPLDLHDPPDSNESPGLTGTWEAYPYDVSVQFLLDPNAAPPASLSLLKWSVLGLYAEHVIEVDVPFEASKVWQDVTPTLRVLVRYAGLQCDERHYKYISEVACLNGSVGAFNGGLVDGEKMADYVVIESLLVDSQGNPIIESPPRPVPSIFWSELTENTSLGTVSSSGTLLGDESTDVAGIRYVIAVYPVEVEVPFVLKNIPVPNIPAATRER